MNLLLGPTVFAFHRRHDIALVGHRCSSSLSRVMSRSSTCSTWSQVVIALPIRQALPPRGRRTMGERQPTRVTFVAPKTRRLAISRTNFRFQYDCAARRNWSARIPLSAGAGVLRIGRGPLVPGGVVEIRGHACLGKRQLRSLLHWPILTLSRLTVGTSLSRSSLFKCNNIRGTN
jgi:hypothetical protein